MKKINMRTDLALEEKESFDGTDTEVSGVILKKKYDDTLNVEITKVIIKNQDGAKKMNKPMGNYITLESQELLYPDENYHREISKLVSKYIIELLPKNRPLNVMVIGLGNESVTPDSLGPLTVNNIKMTRHLYNEYKEEGLAECKSNGIISGLIPGVMGKTGMETIETIKAVSSQTKPEAMIVIDALAARMTKRLNTTIQITDTGINPGGGVGNFRGYINKENMKMPVIAIGIPTVIDAATICYDTLKRYILKEDENLIKQLIDPYLGTMYVTPNDIDETVKMFSYTLSEAVNLAFKI